MRPLGCLRNVINPLMQHHIR